MDDLDTWRAYMDALHKEAFRDATAELVMMLYFYGIWHPADGDWISAPWCDPLENVL